MGRLNGFGDAALIGGFGFDDDVFSVIETANLEL